MSADRFSLDTNILIYSADKRDARKHAFAIEIVTAAARKDCPLALQSLGEFYVTATRKAKLDPADAQKRADQLLTSFETFSYSRNAVAVALREAALGRFSFWDGVLLASAAEAGCTILFSEDMADGARLGTITVRQPFDQNGLAPLARQVLDLK